MRHWQHCRYLASVCLRSNPCPAPSWHLIAFVTARHPMARTVFSACAISRDLSMAPLPPTKASLSTLLPSTNKTKPSPNERPASGWAIYWNAMEPRCTPSTVWAIPYPFQSWSTAWSWNSSASISIRRNRRHAIWSAKFFAVTIPARSNSFRP